MSIAPSYAAPSSAGLDGRRLVITGASDGIGRSAARMFAASGAQVVMIGRNEAKTAAAARAIMSDLGTRNVTWEVADLSRQDAVRDLAQRLHDTAPIDVLVNNAGALFLERELTAEGLERTFALNHLAYFTLTVLLLDRLAAAARPGAPARVINVSSRAHREARLSMADVQLEQRYAGWRAYANSKLANILFTRALARRVDPAKIVVHALHPGVVSTRFAVNNGRRGRMLRRVMDVVSITPDAGADTLVWLARDDRPLASTGGYWVKRAPMDPSNPALDDGLAEQLWQYSVECAGLDADALVSASGAKR
jgi:NAD(P)-dependent dehydrogenase (short-subunit alcohol dehydrogenase family)